MLQCSDDRLLCSALLLVCISCTPYTPRRVGQSGIGRAPLRLPFNHGLWSLKGRGSHIELPSSIDSRHDCQLVVFSRLSSRVSTNETDVAEQHLLSRASRLASKWSVGTSIHCSSKTLSAFLLAFQAVGTVGRR
ncbi:hypothetical protein K461DRAFT_2522 [Myriangium duriaei CBS 260.36]|uniref:Secreted protein n=1 Tax=Myriangium duriaei CBS 260.36 TaxID=1168546 RepID=A0A9P4JD70_9PEZI|nr:hypothetical protein K461DRAFT_2522 [Myriangium duriaei CBS 260.36]